MKKATPQGRPFLLMTGFRLPPSAHLSELFTRVVRKVETWRASV